MESAIVLVAGLLAGALGAMLGLGGGVFLIPVLTVGLGLPAHTAIGTSLLCVIMTSCAGASGYLRAGMTNVRLAIAMLVTTSLGAIVGGLLAVRFADTVLLFLFAFVLVYTGATMLGVEAPRRGTDRASERQKKQGRTAKALRMVEAQLSADYVDPGLREHVAYRPERLGTGVIAGVFAGGLSGLLGIGGGVIQVPIMHLIMKVPLKAAIATSNYVIGATAAASAFIYFGNGLINPSAAAPAVLGVFVGALVGTRITRRSKPAWLAKLMGIILLVVAVQTILKALNVRLF